MNMHEMFRFLLLFKIYITAYSDYMFNNLHIFSAGKNIFISK